jgi:hypothetical protein
MLSLLLLVQTLHSYQYFIVVTLALLLCDPSGMLTVCVLLSTGVGVRRSCCKARGDEVENWWPAGTGSVQICILPYTPTTSPLPDTAASACCCLLLTCSTSPTCAGGVARQGPARRQTGCPQGLECCGAAHGQPPTTHNMAWRAGGK